mgnify:CR=1 FL=1
MACRADATENGTRREHGQLPHRVLGLERIAVAPRQRAVVPNGPGEHVRNLVGHERVHDAALDQSCLHRLLDGAERSNLVDRPHVKAMAAVGGLSGAGHAQCGAEDRGFDVVNRDRIRRRGPPARTVADEPLEVSPRAGMHQRRSRHPDEVTALRLFLVEPRGELLIVDRALTAHLGGHEAELVRAMRPAEESFGVNVDALGAVLRQSHGDRVALLEDDGAR